jgi:hypothetical protein
MTSRRILLSMLAAVALTLACRAAPPPAPPATAANARNAPPAGPDLSSPQSVTRAWVAAVSAGNWTAVVPLVPPASQDRARAAIAAGSAGEKAKLQETARKLAAAMASKPPEFVLVQAILAEPTHQEWYFCGRKPQGDVWQGPCTFSVIEMDGRWYFLSVRDDPDSD